MIHDGRKTVFAKEFIGKGHGKRPQAFGNNDEDEREEAAEKIFRNKSQSQGQHSAHKVLEQNTMTKKSNIAARKIFNLYLL